MTLVTNNDDNDNADVYRGFRVTYQTGKSKQSEQDCIPVGCVPPARWPYRGGRGCLLLRGGGDSATCGRGEGCKLLGGCLLFVGGVCFLGEGCLLLGGLCFLGGVSASCGGMSTSWGVSASGGGICFGGCLPLGGVCFWGGVCLFPGGGGIPACTEADTPLWTEWMTDTYKNITFANYVCGHF